MKSAAETLVQLACQDLQNNQLAAAEAKSVRALEADREHTGAWNILGMILQARGRHDDAIRVFNSLALKQPTDAAPWANLGAALRGAKRHGEALAAYQHALTLAAPTAQTLYNIALVQIELFDYESAHAALRQAIDMAPRDAWIRTTFAQCCYDIGSFEDAVVALENWAQFDGLTPANMAQIASLLVTMGEPGRAGPAIEWLRLNPPDGQAALTLINVLERTNQLDEARSSMQRLKASLSSAPDPDLLLSEAVLAQRDGHDDEACRLLLLALNDHTDFIRRHNLLFPLAKSLDALGRYQEAFAALGEAHRSQVAYLQAALGKMPTEESPTISLANRGVEPGEPASWRDEDAPPMASSPIFVVGFPRSGTTLLEQTLDAHPSLRSMDEQPFLKRAVDQMKSFGLEYPADLKNLSAAQLHQIRSQYWERVDRKATLRSGQRLVDKNPLNLLRLPLIRRLFPHAATILVTRHPCDVLLSCLTQQFRAPDLAMLCRDLPTLAHSYRRAFDYWYQQLPLLGASTYELRYESLVADFPAQVRNLADFLALSWDAAMLAPADHSRAKKFISTPSYAQVVQPVSGKSIGRWQNYRRHFDQVMPLLEPYIRRWGH